MKNRFYFFNEHFNKLIGFLILCWFFFSFGSFLLILFLTSIVLLMFSKVRVKSKDEGSFTSSIVLSPVSGKVQKIYDEVIIENQNYKVIKMASSPLGFFDILSPFKSTVVLAKESTEPRRWRLEKIEPLDGFEETTIIQLSNKKNLEVILRFVPCHLGARPVIWCNSGDLAEAQSPLGYFPFGGSVLFYLPQDSNLQVVVGDKVEAGRTVIAGLKE
jgi:phosphatidylserine decarboxylase